MYNKKNTYFGELDYFSKDYASCVQGRFDEFQEMVSTTGLRDAIEARWRMFNLRGGDGRHAGIEAMGEQGELLNVPVNEYASLIRNQLVMATTNPVAFQSLAINDDDESLEAAMVSDQLVDYYAETAIEAIKRSYAETALTQPAAWCSCLWNPLMGSEVAADEETGEMIFGGDIEHRVHTIFDVAYPLDTPDIRNPEWFDLRVMMNKFILAKLFPKHKDRILEKTQERDAKASRGKLLMQKVHSDYIPVLYSFTKPNAIVLGGRTSIVLDDDTVLLDGPSPYSRIPAVLLADSIVIGENLPKTSNFELYPIMQLQQNGYSVLAGAMDAAHQVLASLDDPSETSVEDLGPFKILYCKQFPQTLQMFNATKEMFQYPEMLRQVAQRFSMVTDAARGLSQASESGAKMKAEAAISQGFQGGFLNQLNKALAEIATLDVEILKNHVKEERVVAIVGKRKRSQVIRFTGETLKPIQRVRVANADPALETPQGKQQLADFAASKGWISTPDEYVTVRRTGSLDVAEGKLIDVGSLVRRHMDLLIDPEAPIEVREEQSPDGVPMRRVFFDGQPMNLETDDHRRAMEEVRRTLLRQDVRQNPEAVQRLQAYFLEHTMMLTPGSPLYAAGVIEATGQQPLSNPTQGQQPNPGGQNIPPGTPIPSVGPAQAGPGGPKEQPPTGGPNEPKAMMDKPDALGLGQPGSAPQKGK